MFHNILTKKLHIEKLRLLVDKKEFSKTSFATQERARDARQCHISSSFETIQDPKDAIGMG